MNLESTFSLLDPHFRLDLIERQLRPRGVVGSSLLETMMNVPRELFLPSKFFQHAYDDAHVPIGFHRLSYSPILVAMMTEAAELQGSDRVLDVGTGCGYPAAIASHLCHQVFTIEGEEDLYDDACDRFQTLGLKNVAILYGSKSFGFPQFGPYNAILLREIDEGNDIPPLLEQLALLGRIVFLRRYFDGREELIRITRLSSDTYIEESLGDLPTQSLLAQSIAATSIDADLSL